MTDVQVIDAAPAALPEMGRRRRAGGFAVTTAILSLFQLASAAPAPLYVVYQREWAFSSATLTLIFAVFVFGLLGSLLTLGGLSDHLGRRPVLAAAIAAEAAAVTLFLVAGSVPVLLVARIVQGIATGLALPALGATLVDLNPPHAPGRAAAVNAAVPVGGLAAGALGSSALVQFAPDPTRLVWALLLGALLVALPALLTLPRIAARRGGIAGSLAPRIGVPRRLRGDVRPLVPLIVASWALGGLYLSLGPSVVLHVYGISSHFLGGLVVTVLCGTGAVTVLALRGRPARAVARTAAGMLAAGTAITTLGMVTGSVPAALAGTVAAGIGYGAAGLATFGALADLAGPAGAAERGALFAFAYTVAFLALSLPAVAAGYAAMGAGLRATVIGYAVLVIATGLAALCLQEARAARRARARARSRA
jgi:MFS family permease